MHKIKRTRWFAAAAILLFSLVGVTLLAQTGQSESAADESEASPVRRLTLYVDSSMHNMPEDLADNPQQRYHLIGHIETRTGLRRIEIASDCIVRSKKRILRPRQRPTEIQSAWEVALEMPLTAKNLWFNQALIDAIARDHSLDLFELWTVPIDKAPHRGGPARPEDFKPGSPDRKAILSNNIDDDRLIMFVDSDRYPVTKIYEMLVGQKFSIAVEKKENGVVADAFRLATDCDFMFAAHTTNNQAGKARSLIAFRAPENPSLDGHQLLVLEHLGYEFSLLDVSEPSRDQPRKTATIEVPLGDESPAVDVLRANIGNQAIYVGVVFQTNLPGAQDPVEAYNVLAQRCELVGVKTKPGPTQKPPQRIAILETNAGPPQKGEFLLTQALIDEKLEAGNRFRLEGVFDPEKTPYVNPNAGFPVAPLQAAPTVVRIPTDPIDLGNIKPAGDGSNRFDIQTFRDKSAPQLFAEECIVVITGEKAPNVTWAIPQDGLHPWNRKVSQQLVDSLLKQGYKFRAQLRRPVPVLAATTATPPTLYLPPPREPAAMEPWSQSIYYPALPGATTLPPPLNAPQTPIPTPIAVPSFSLPQFSPMFNPALARKLAKDQAIAELNKATTDEEKSAAREKLRQALADIFTADMLRRYEKTREIEAQLKRLRDQHEARDQAKEEIIDLQLKLLEKQAAGLDFPATGPTNAN